MLKYTYKNDGSVNLKGRVQIPASDYQTQELMKRSNELLNKKPQVKEKALDMFKALDTQTDSEGGYLTEEILFQGIMEKLRIQGNVAPLFRDITMSQNVENIPTELDQVDIYLTPENTQATGQTAYSSSNPTYGRGVLTANKFTGRSWLSGELEEDAVIDMIRNITDSHSKGIAKAMDQAILAGDNDGSHQDSDVSNNGRDVRTAFDGLRRLALDASLTVDAGNTTLSTSNIASATEIMGKYAVNEDDVKVVLSPRSYHQLKNEALQTSNNSNAAFEFENGKLVRINGHEIIKSEHVRDDLNSNGVYDGTTTDRSVAYVVNVNEFVTGTRSSLSLESQRNPEYDQTELFSRLRKAFAPIWTPSSSQSNVALVYNIAK